MSRPRRLKDAVVFIAEDMEMVPSPTGFDRYYTGRFHGHRETRTRFSGTFEDLGLDEALAWAHERAQRSVIRFGPGPHYAIGFTGEGTEPWPDGGLPAPQRRRVPDEAWKDRTEADPETDWTVTFALEPPEAPDVDFHRPEWDVVVDAFAARIGAEWSANELDGYLAELHAVVRRARRAGAEEWGWYTERRRAYEVRWLVRASTVDGARAAADVAAPRLPDGWRVEVGVGYRGG